MTLKRLDLPDGQWADLLVKPKHAEYFAILEAYEDAVRGRGTMVRWALTVGEQYTKAWGIRGEDGQPVKDGDWPALEPDYSDAICTEAQNRYQEWSENRVPLVTPRPRRASRTGTSEPSSESTPEVAPST